MVTVLSRQAVILTRIATYKVEAFRKGRHKVSTPLIVRVGEQGVVDQKICAQISIKSCFFQTRQKRARD
jgi:hypothetical protein